MGLVQGNLWKSEFESQFCYNPNYISISENIEKKRLKLLVFGLTRQVIDLNFNIHWDYNTIASIILKHLMNWHDEACLSFKIKRTHLNSFLFGTTIEHDLKANGGRRLILIKSPLSKQNNRITIMLRDNKCSMNSDSCNAGYYNVELLVIGIRKKKEGKDLSNRMLDYIYNFGTINNNYVNNSTSSTNDGYSYNDTLDKITNIVYNWENDWNYEHSMIQHFSKMVDLCKIDGNNIEIHGYNAFHIATQQDSSSKTTHIYGLNGYSFINSNEIRYESPGFSISPHQRKMIGCYNDTYSFDETYFGKRQFKTLIEMKFDQQKYKLSFWKNKKQIIGQNCRLPKSSRNSNSQSDINSSEKQHCFDNGVFTLKHDFVYFPLISSVGCDCTKNGVVLGLMNFSSV